MKIKKTLLISISLTLIALPFLHYFLLDEINLNHPYEITYKANDKVIVNTIHDKIAHYVSINDVPKEFIDYLLCIEDKNFYKHNGVNYKRLIKAALNNVTSDSLQGGSTITMQLARMIYLSNKKSIIRKYDEINYAYKLEKNLTKTEILEYYLNGIYFAHGIYGVENASLYYFNKHINELVLFEMAMLIGILNSPNNYSPYLNLENSLQKTKNVLNILRANNLISNKQYYDAFNYELKLINHNKQEEKYYAYYLDGVHQEIEKKHLLSEKNLRYGVEIETFLVDHIQKMLFNLVKRMDFKDYNLSICIMETNTPKVVALLGGKNYLESSFNRALNSKKQIGSTIKPFLYYLALLNGFNPLTELKSEPTTFHIKNYGDYKVTNVNDIYANRKITLLEALAMSDNIYAVKTLLTIGIKPLIKLLKSFSLDVDVNNITLALGTNSMSLLELTSLYNCLASGGIYYKPQFIKSIKEKNTIYKASTNKKRILYKKESEIIRHLLRSPFDIGLKTYANPTLLNYYISPSFGGKTGSTESSSYVIGFSKKYTIGVYVGSDDNTYLNKGYLSRELFYQICKYLYEDDTYFDVTSSLNAFSLYNTLNKKHTFNYYY